MHVVQLFDDIDSRADALARFVTEGIAAGDVLLVVVPTDHWNAAAKRLRASDIAIEPLIESGRVTVLGALETLKRFERAGALDARAFDRTVGALVRELSSRGAPLRICGEMVDVLASRGEFDNAQQLEALWNELHARVPFTLFCAYSAVNFGDPRSARALRTICHAHSHVEADHQDVLGSYLLAAYGVRPVGADRASG